MCFEDYIAEFCASDEECYKNDIDNAHAMEWLQNEIPRLECPDAEIEKTYYFRWWVYRKHIKSTPEGFVITEFLPDVPWSGKYNVINAAAGHHLMEGRWLHRAKRYLEDYIEFFFRYPGEGMRYSSWLIWAAAAYHDVTGALQVTDFLKEAVPHYLRWETERKTPCGLYWSIDDRDAMEYSISGSGSGRVTKGVRPTLNSYMYGNASAIYDLSVECGHPMDAFYDRAAAIKADMNRLLFRDGFYKALHPENGAFERLDQIDTAKVSRELIGYIPWYFKMPDPGQERVFDLLEDKNVFAADFGITTAEQSDPRFLFPVDHECLWNGYLWPFATSQVLTGLIAAVDTAKEKEKYAGLFYRLLLQYARQHTKKEQGQTQMWIDEVKAPDKDEWSSRTLLKKWGWPKEKGGYERGKDYNHSTFCDLVISGLAGVRPHGSSVRFCPMIPRSWEYFCLDSVRIHGKDYRISYDKTGQKYGHTGWRVTQNGKEIQKPINAILF